MRTKNKSHIQRAIVKSQNCHRWNFKGLSASIVNRSTQSVSSFERVPPFQVWTMSSDKSTESIIFDDKRANNNEGESVDDVNQTQEEATSTSPDPPQLVPLVKKV